MDKRSAGVLRDPVWQFIGIIVAVASLLFAAYTFYWPRSGGPVASTASTPAVTPRSGSGETGTPTPRASLFSQRYFAAAPGPRCDRGAARWRRLSGYITCNTSSVRYVSDKTAEALVTFSPGGESMPSSYQVGVNVTNILQNTCVDIIVRNYYALGACAWGNAAIIRYDQEPVYLASRNYSVNSFLQITATVSGSWLGLHLSNGSSDDIDMSAVDSTYPEHGDSIKVDVYTSSGLPADATLSYFRYQSPSPTLAANLLVWPQYRVSVST
jgi:hypothetical protein